MRRFVEALSDPLKTRDHPPKSPRSACAERSAHWLPVLCAIMLFCLLCYFISLLADPAFAESHSLICTKQIKVGLRNHEWDISPCVQRRAPHPASFGTLPRSSGTSLYRKRLRNQKTLSRIFGTSISRTWPSDLKGFGFFRLFIDRGSVFENLASSSGRDSRDGGELSSGERLGYFASSSFRDVDE